MRRTPEMAPLTDLGPAGNRRWGLRGGGRAIGMILGSILLVGAMVMVWRQREFMGEALVRITQPSPGGVSLLIFVIGVQLILSGLLYSILMTRYGRVGGLEMQGLIAASALLNYLPLRAGMFGRLTYHRTVNGIPISAAARTVGEAVIISMVASGLIAGVIALAIYEGINPWVLTGGIGVLLVGGCLGTGLRRWFGAGVMRWADLMLWAVRYHVAFALLGAPLDWTTALALAGLSSLANMIPFFSNGLGLREWGVGMMAPLLTDHAITLEFALAAELVNRAVEVAVFTVAGSAGLGYLSVRKRRRSPRPPDA